MVYKLKPTLLMYCLFVGGLFFPPPVLAQGGAAGAQDAKARQGLNSSLTAKLFDQSGGVITQAAVVTLTSVEEGRPKQITTRSGEAFFENIDPGRYIIHVVADGYEPRKESYQVAAGEAVANISLQPSSQSFDKANMTYGGNVGNAYLAASVNLQKDRLMMKSMAAIRDHKPDRARSSLDQLTRDYPFDANVSYMNGMYEKELKDLPKARYYWEKAIGLDPKHYASLMELGHSSLDENKPAEAIPYLSRAAQQKPTAWQPHALLTMAYSKEKNYAEVVTEADKALEFGHSEAVALQPLLARALVEQGNKERAVHVLQDFLKTYCDEGARELLASLQPSGAPVPAGCAGGAAPDFPELLPSAWMPAGVDDTVPAVESGVPCSLDTVLQNAGVRANELIRDVDRFEATESLEDERITGKGVPSKAETRSYRYLVSIGEVRPGLLSVEEYHGPGIGPSDFPEGIQTSGLPALVLVFHPLQVPDYKFTCEGLTRTDAGLSWQVYFQQRPDKIPTLHGYSLGDQSYAVGLKGRAWVAADTYQVVRLETELTKPHPEIRLAAEHTLITYGPVRFHSKDIQMWLPQRAEVYFDWRGKRVHRKLSYSNYMLYSVDDKQTMKPPKDADVPPAGPPANPPQVKPPN